MKRDSYWAGRTVSRLLGMQEAIGLSGSVRLLLNAYGKKRKLFPTRLAGLSHPVMMRAYSTDINVFSQVFSMREYDMSRFSQSEAITQRYNDLVAAGRSPLIIDCGANIGMATLWWIRQFPKARIVAIEPSSENFQVLQKNCEAYGNVSCVCAAVWDTETAVSIENPAAEAWAFQMTQALPGQSTLPTVTLSSIIAQEHAEDSVLFIKIDIEGGEKQLFQSNTAWMDKTPLIIIELHDSLQPHKMTSSTFIREIAKRDSEMCIWGENMFVFLGVGPRQLEPAP